MKKHENSYQKNYYVSVPIPEGFKAGSKAFIDCEIIFQNLSFKSIQISIFDTKEQVSENHKKRSGIKRIFRKMKYLLKLSQFIVHGLLARKYLHSNIVYQTLNPNIDLLVSIVLRRMFKYGKRLIVVHDLESLRIRKAKLFPQREGNTSVLHSRHCALKGDGELSQGKVEIQRKNLRLGLF